MRRVPARLTRAAATVLAVVALPLAAGCGNDSGTAPGHGSAAGAATDTGAAPRIEVTGAFLPEPVTTGMAACFFTVHNTGGSDTLTAVTSDVAAKVTMHRTVDGAMRPQASFPVPAHGSLVFRHGGDHVMFEQLTRKPHVGSTVPVELHFRRAGTVRVSVPVKPATYDPKAHEPAMHDPAMHDPSSDPSS